MSQDAIIISGAREHNLKNITVRIPRHSLTVITGLSGSGKSSLAFDTLFAEGQRRYVESLSAYARQFLDQMQKPDVDRIDGLSPAIAIEQRTAGFNPRSTVATATEIYDYLRLLFAHVGQPHCPRCGQPIASQSVSQIVDQILARNHGAALMLLAPLVRRRKGEFRDVFDKIRREGFVRVRVDGQLMELEQGPAAARWRGHDDEPPRQPGLRLAKNTEHNIELVVDRLTVDPKYRARLADSIETAIKWGNGVVLALTKVESGSAKIQAALPTTSKPRKRSADSSAPTWSETLYSTLNACSNCAVSYGQFTPRHFSFNSPAGACPHCQGLGTRLKFDPDLVVPDKNKSLDDGAIAAWRRGGRRLVMHYKMLLRNLARQFAFALDKPWNELDQKTRNLILQGSGAQEVEFTYWRKGAWRKINKPFEGVIPNLERLYAETESEFTKKRLQQYMTRQACASCRGRRLRAEVLAVTLPLLTDSAAASAGAERADPRPDSPVALPRPSSRKVAGYSITDITHFSLEQAAHYFARIPLTAPQQAIARDLLKEIRSRLQFLLDVGLGYLTLDRESGTLSGGEAQRLRLATQIGASLVGVLYILDEPSIGLHPRDNARLLQTLKQMRDLGNTVVVVEHDEETIRGSDYVIDLGPGAGARGGYVVAQGPIGEFLAHPQSLTAKYLRGEEKIPVPRQRRPARAPWLVVLGASENNLRAIDVRIPLGCFVCVTGVSGSGKSTLVDDILRRALARKFYRSREKPGAHADILGAEELDKMIVIDQSPIGRTPRSNPATYSKVFDHVRNLFAALPSSRIRGYKASRFSFNAKGGRCEACKGDGLIKIEMHFLPDVYVECQTCHGQRYNRETLEITYKGRNIADVLAMSVDEALDFFRAVPQIESRLRTLAEVGLGYVKLGQQATTLSGGEAQRVKLASELAKHATGRTLYILDEPTTGLHFEDVRNLLDVLNRLVDQGNTVLVIEHNLDVIKSADYVIDLGPEGGERGGRLVAEGTPEQLAAVPASYTGQFLRKVLQ
jgi:excinuclease ABC subunit A